MADKRVWGRYESGKSSYLAIRQGGISGFSNT